MTDNEKTITKKITKANRLIEASYTMMLNEKRLLLLGISKINAKVDPQKDKPFMFTITHQEWIKYYPEGQAYRNLKKAAKGLEACYLTLHPKEGITDRIAWFDSIRYDDNKGQVSLRFSWSVQQCLAGLHEHFTELNFLELTKLDTFYSIRLFEMLIQFKKSGWKEIDIDDLKKALGCEGRYRTTKDFKRSVVMTAVKEINKKTSYTVTVENKKVGRKIVGLKFKFKPKRKSTKPRSDNLAEGLIIGKSTKLSKVNDYEGSFVEIHSDTSWATGIQFSKKK